MDNLNSGQNQNSAPPPVGMSDQPIVPPPDQAGFGMPAGNMPPFVAEQYQNKADQDSASPSATQGQGAQQQQQQQSQEEPPKANSGGGFKKVLFFVLAMLLIVVLVIAAVVLVFPKLQDKLPTQQRGELVWWGLWEDDTIIKPLIEEYQKENPNVKITYIAQSKADYRDRLNNAIASGQGPDIFRIHNTWVPMFIGKLATMPTDVMTDSEFQATFYPVAYSNLKTSTGIVGMPLEYDGLAMFINEDIFATYFKSVPTTWEEMEQIAQELTIRDENGIVQQAGVAMGTIKTVDHWQEIVALLMLQNGVDLNNIALTPELSAYALDYYTKYGKEFKVWDDTQPNSTVAFAVGRLAMYFAPSWRAFEIWERNPSLKFRTYPVPQLNKVSPTDPDVGYASYWVESVNEASENKDIAWDFLEFMSRKESLEKFYQEASKVRKFGEPYPRQDMADMLANDQVVGGVLATAPNATSWYLTSRTFDGQTGINTKMSQYFENSLNQMIDGRGYDDGERQLPTLNQGINQVLSEYGLAIPIQTPEP